MNETTRASSTTTTVNAELSATGRPLPHYHKRAAILHDWTSDEAKKMRELYLLLDELLHAPATNRARVLRMLRRAEKTVEAARDAVALTCLDGLGWNYRQVGEELGITRQGCRKLYG